MAGLLAGLIGAALCALPLVLQLEQNAGLSWLFQLRGPLAPPEDVAVVAISGAAADRLGLSSQLNEWPRNLHAELLDRLSAAGASAIAIDILFDRPRNRDWDAELAAAVANAGNVILAERVQSDDVDERAGAPRIIVDRRFEPIPMLKDAALGTAPFTLPSVPIRVSQFWVFGRSLSELPSLPVVTLQAHLLSDYEVFVSLLAGETDATANLPDATKVREQRMLEDVVGTIRGRFLSDAELGRRLHARLARLALPAGEKQEVGTLIDAYAGPDSRYINYYGPPRTIETIDYDSLIGPNGFEAALSLAGKAVFVGYSERRQSERQQDEFYSVFSEQSGLSLSGVEIGATAFANLLDGSSIYALPMPAYVLSMFFWSFLLGSMLADRAAPWAVISALVLGTTYFLGAWWAFEKVGVWLPIVAADCVVLPLVLLSSLFMRYRELSAQRHRIQAALGYYVPPSIVSRLAHESFEADASAELVHGTCLISDAEQFTRLAESLDPEALHELVQQYFAVLSAAVERRGGFVADISGDSMVAIWAAARPDWELRREACLAALNVLEEVTKFNVGRGRQSLPTGVGLDSGELLLGSISFAQRLQYRAVGDIVNTASRIQGLNRQLGTRALLSSSTLEALPGLVSRKVGDFVLVGKTHPTEVHELLGHGPESRKEHRMLIQCFAVALESFRRREWSEASKKFGEILATYYTGATLSTWPGSGKGSQ